MPIIEVHQVIVTVVRAFPPAVTVVTTTLPTATIAIPYAQTITASGGAGGPYTFSVVAGALPAWATLSSAGLLSGTASVVVPPATFTVQAIDTPTGVRSTRSLTVTTTAPILIAPSALPTAQPTVLFTQQLVASGAVAPYTFAVVSGTLPPWATLSSAGLLTGTPPAVATFTPAALPDAVVDATYNVTIAVTLTGVPPAASTFVVRATSFDARAVDWSYTLTTAPYIPPSIRFVAITPLPRCLSLLPSGALTGRAMQVGLVPVPVTIQAIDPRGYTWSVTYTLTVRPS